MTQQKVTITLSTQNGIKLGTLLIGTSFSEKTSKVSPDKLTSFDNGSAVFENILRVRNPGDSIPIEYNEEQCETTGARLLLLEETDYQIVFRSEYDIDESRGDSILLELTDEYSERNVIFNKWLLDEDQRVTRGVLNFSSFVGKSYFDVKINNQYSKKFPFEVRSKKIGYKDQYPAMIGDISEACSGLILDRTSPLFQELQFSKKNREFYYEDYMFLEFLFNPNRLPLAYEMIRRNPYRRLRVNEEPIDSALVSNIGFSSLVDIATGREEHIRVHQEVSQKIPQFDGLFPMHVIQETNFDDMDIPENQLVKDLLLSIDYIIDRLLDSPVGMRDCYIKDRLKMFMEIIQTYLSDEWLSDISNMRYIPTNSQVLQKKEGYTELFHYHLNLDLSFRLRWKDFEDSVKGYNQRLSLLYEYWCYLELIKVLTRLSGTQVSYDDMFQKSGDGWSIHLKKGVGSIKDFFITADNETVRVKLMYNRKFTRQPGQDGFNSYTFSFKPDFTLCIDTGTGPFLIHFDAKYRSDKEEQIIDESNQETQKSERTFWEDDVCKMHTYKDAILRTEGAYILYPGSGEVEIFKVNTSQEIPSVGALSLTPGQSEMESKKLEWFIKAIVKRAIDRDRMISTT